MLKAIRIFFLKRRMARIRRAFDRNEWVFLTTDLPEIMYDRRANRLCREMGKVSEELQWLREERQGKGSSRG